MKPQVILIGMDHEYLHLYFLFTAMFKEGNHQETYHK